MFDATQMILRLEDWCYRETFWPRLLQDGVLFEGLHVLVGQRQVPPNLLDWVKDSQREFPQDLKRYQVARALICCAHLAEQPAKTVQNQAIPFGEVDEALIALKDMPDECIPPRQESWARGCIYSFLTPPRWPRWVDMPVAVYQTGEVAKGFIGTLKLEASPHAVGLSHHPGDTLTTGFDGFDDRFVESMNYAWEAANALALSGQTDEKVSWRGRWRLLGPDGQPMPVKGASASGAAALGWYHVLTNTLPDPGIIVLAQINKTGELGEIDGIPEKVAAIVAENERRSAEINKQRSSRIQLLDTIAVAGGENHKAAEAVLRKHDKSGLCRVVLIDSKKARN